MVRNWIAQSPIVNRITIGLQTTVEYATLNVYVVDYCYLLLQKGFRGVYCIRNKGNQP